MLVYRTETETVAPARELALLREAPVRTPDDKLDLLIRLGQLESAIADWLSPQADGDHPTAAAFRTAGLAAAHALANDAWLPTRASSLAALTRCELPPSVALRTPEGFAYYALYPEMYLEAARRFYRDARPARVVVIGIRSIGATLASLAGAALEDLGCTVESITVRPRGHPFAREVHLEPELEARLSRLSAAHFAIVDEGPGLSGSSFAAVAGVVSRLGVPDDRITLFPSWIPSPDAFRSEAARARWPRHAKYAVAFEEVWPAAALADLSGGEWRGRLCDGIEWPAVQPQHERRKYLREGRLLKFAGHGRFGRAQLARAEALAAAGWSPLPLALENGFLEMEFVPGRPLRGRADLTRELLDAIAAYLSFLAKQPPARPGASFGELLQMIEFNTGGAVRAAPLEFFRTVVTDAPAVAIDGRMLPHEWLLTSTGYLKTDSLDHHNDHFLPGCQNIAWDAAAASVEFGLDENETEYLVRRSSVEGLRALLPFYTLAYLAFRLGYVTLAREAIEGTPDADRFRLLESRYRAMAVGRYRSPEAPAGPSR